MQAQNDMAYQGLVNNAIQGQAQATSQGVTVAGNLANSVGQMLAGGKKMSSGGQVSAPTFSVPPDYHSRLASSPQSLTALNYGLASGGPVHPALSILLQAAGGKVPGKAEVAGDDPRNDKVPAVLSAGEIVLPRSVTQDEDAAEKSKRFVAAIQRKHRLA
jgi:hypothetical protein